MSEALTAPAPPISAPRIAAESTLACVIPMFNEAQNALRFLQALTHEMAPRFAHLQLIVIDDGSEDATRADVLKAIATGLPVRYQRFSRNFGKEAAVAAGLAAAGEADAVLIIDADFQHPFPIALQMVTHWEAGYDSVYGVQGKRRNESLTLRHSKRLFYRLMQSTDRFDIPQNAGDFRLLDRRVVAALNQLPERTRYMKGLYAWVGFTGIAVPFDALPRRDGESSFNLRQLTELALDGLTAFSSWPLRVASILGSMISVAALIYGVWIVIETLWQGGDVPGYATLAASLMLFSGVQLMSIGLLGEYLGRVFVEVKGRPLYLLAEDVQAPDASPPVAR